jgi:hypothetical protein
MEVDEKKEKPLYVWSQDAEEITVTFALAEPIKKSDVVYTLTSQNVDVEIKGVKLLSGQLEGAIHLDNSTWTFDDKRFTSLNNSMLMNFNFQLANYAIQGSWSFLARIGQGRYSWSLSTRSTVDF